MPQRGRQGGNTSSVEYSPEKLDRIRKAKARQEARWQRKNGPVTVRTLTDDEMRERGL